MTIKTLNTTEKVELLKRHIVASTYASDLCKRTAIWLIDQTKNLTRSVKCIFHEPDINEIQGLEIINGIHGMNDANRSTKLYEFRKSHNMNFYLGVESFDNNISLIWIGIGSEIEDRMSRKVDNAFNFDMAAINTIDLDQYR